MSEDSASVQANDGLSRRQFLKNTGVTGSALVIAFYLPAGRRAEAASVAGSLQPNAWLTVDLDGTVTVINDKSEIGQGISGGFVSVIADELGADLAMVRLGEIPTDPSNWVGRMGVSGSRSMRGAWGTLRVAGAQARAVLVEAAASEMGVAAADCYTEAGFVIHRASGNRLPFSAVVAAASLLTPPENPTLKDPSEFTIIGKQDARPSIRDQVTGKAIYGMDVQPENMLYATIERAPVFGASVRSVDETAARKVPGFVRTVQVPADGRSAVQAGVAVVAQSYYAATKARAALHIDWDLGANTGLNSDDIHAELMALSQVESEAADTEGDFASAYAAAAKKLDVTYSVPYLHHMTMEPMNCTAHVRADSCELWAPSQQQGGAQTLAATLTGLQPAQVRIHTPAIGGGFGRRLKSDFVYESVVVAREFDVPVKTIWTREDDVRYGGYRPMAACRMQGGSKSDGTIEAMRATLATQDRFGAPELFYHIANKSSGKNSASNDIPTGAWRGIHHTYAVFFTESFMDELAHAAGEDPVAYRLRHLAQDSLYARVIRAAAEASDWGSPLPAGRARGIAVAEALADTYIAQVVEASVENGRPVVHKVTCVVDCGIAVSPGSVKAQAEGSIVWAQTAALYGEINVRNGAVVQSNFHDYMALRMNEVPEIEVVILPSDRDPGGMGEPAVPPFAPALANAIFAATGQRLRHLPFRLA